MNSIRSLVVDDELFTRHFIIDLIRELNPAFDIVGEADSVKNAYSQIIKTKPEVVFLDIRMPDGSAFDLLNMFYEINFEVVFISGFDNYALKAFEFNALDYILKPVEPEKFERTLNKLMTKMTKRTFQPEDLKTIVRSYDLKRLIISRIPVHLGNKVVLVDVDDIVSIRSEERYSAIKTAENQEYISSRQLSDYDFIFAGHPNILRVNKGTYINLNMILSYSKGSMCAITMKDGSVIEVPRRKKQEILELLAGKKKEL